MPYVTLGSKDKILFPSQTADVRTLSTNAEETLLNPSDDLPTLEWADTSKLSEYKLTPPSISLFERVGLV